MRILKSRNNWFKIQSVHDNYEGWIRSNLITTVEENVLDSPFVTAELINTVNIGDVHMRIPVGSTLPGFSDGEGGFGTLKYKFNVAFFNRNEIKPDKNRVAQLTMQWLNAPYLWGGRTPFGVDCSGFVQVVFKMMGVNLLRDAWLQAGQGMKVKTLQQAECGDLAFFTHKKRKITHVGILLGPSQIVHASGKVRIDAIDDEGIINSDSGKRTHTLVAIRKVW